MRLPSLVAIALSLLFAGGCLDEVVPEHNPPAADGSATMSMSDAGSTAMDSAVVSDGATLGDGGLAAFGATCATNADCQSGICQPSNAGASMACTQMCSSPGQNDPSCPGGGLCNMRGYCKTT